MDAAQIAISLLELAAKALPGLLAIVSGTQSDEEALDKARESVRGIPSRPAGDALDAYERGE